MRFRGLVQPPCDGVLPLLPLRWGAMSLRASGEQFSHLTRHQRLQAMAVVSVRLLRLSEQTEQFLRHRNPIRYLHFFTSLPCLILLYRFACYVIWAKSYSQVWISVRRCRCLFASAPACVSGGGAPYVCVTQPLTVAERKRRKENRTEKTGLFVFLNVENKKPPRQPRRDKSWGFSLVGLGQWVRAKRLRSALHQERNHIHHIDSKRSQ